MRFVPLIVALLFSSGASFAGEIREFDIRTLEKLGKELSRRDDIAARAADAVSESQPVARAIKMRGWITELGKSEDRVYLIAETSSGPCLTYTVTFRGSAKPEIEDRRGQSLPPNVALRYKAFGTAIGVLRERIFNITYNFEVLNDPDGDGFLVYALGATRNPDEIVMGGHFRATVSGDGEKVERVDALSRTLMIRDKKKSGLPKDSRSVGLYLNQIVSDRPVETLIYTSNLVKRDIFVGTPDRKVWLIHSGRMTLDTSKPDNKSAGGAAQQALRQGR